MPAIGRFRWPQLLLNWLGLTRGFEAAWLKRDPTVVASARTPSGRRMGDRSLFVNLLAARAASVVPEVPWSARHAEPMRIPSSGVAQGLWGRQRPAGAGAQSAAWTGHHGRSLRQGDSELSEADLRLVVDLYDGELIRLDKALMTLVGTQQGGSGAASSPSPVITAVSPAARAHLTRHPDAHG